MIGPEVPLVDGLADRLRAAGRLVFGPGADGARLEGSKAWMKDLLAEAGRADRGATGPSPSVEPALAFLDTMAPPFVVKTDGLAAGKGVVVTESLTEARNAVGDYLSGAAFGDAGRRLVIEEGLVGPEVSVLAVCDGTTAVPAAAGAGLQAGRRRRRRPQHRGDGRLPPGAARSTTALLDDVMDRLRRADARRACAPGASTTGGCSTPG